MHDDLVNLGWTEDQWSRISGTVTEEAQRARVLAQALPVTGPEDPSTLSVPEFALGNNANLAPPPALRMTVNSEPTLPLTTIAINIQLRRHEVADTRLTAALVMFRRAANFIARIEDALIVNGRLGPNFPPFLGVGGIPPVFTVQGERFAAGLSWPAPGVPPVAIPLPLNGVNLVNAVIAATNQLEAAGYGGPYACILGLGLFAVSCNPTGNLVLPRDRILPFLQGPLLKSSAFLPNQGAVVALSGNPIEVVVAHDICVRYLQTTLEPRYVFRVSERVALRIKENAAVMRLI
jgi:uncharacterized linocin/CFP29 family protein